MEQIFAFLPNLFSHWLDIPINGNPRYIIFVVAVLLLLFVFLYVVPALLAFIKVRNAVLDISRKQSEKTAGAIFTKDELKQVFSHNFFASAWSSFRDTLHEQYEFQGGQRQLTRIRSTIPAELVFSTQSLIDSRLHVEFFKHLPGILTGIGIIGTFYGLIHGIQQFDPSLLAKARADATQMEKLFTGLKSLFDEVQGAFIASFFAIGAAMLITILEKALLNLCYRKLEQLCQRLDSLYEGGVGEDYLASLVKSSTENATQMAHLKDSLVNDLSVVLENLTSQQIDQTKALGDLLSAKIQEHIESGKEHGESVREVLEKGLENIGERVANVTGEQGATVTNNLEQLIKTFSDKIDSTFSDRMLGLVGMMDASSQAMNDMQTGFRELLNELRQSGKTEREELTAKVLSLVDTLGSQQSKLESQIADLVESVRSKINESQHETKDFVKNSLEEIQSSVNGILINMDKERKIEAGEERKKREEYDKKTDNLFHEMQSQMGNLIDQIDKTLEVLNQNVTELSKTSITAIDKMNEGAMRISSATNSFSQAGDKISGVMLQAEKVSTQLNQSSNLLEKATSSVGEMLRQYAGTRDAIAKMVTEMGGMLDRAKQEAGMNQQIVQKMQSTVDNFKDMNAEADRAFAAIADKLAETLVKFREDMVKHDAEFHKHHADTLNKVASAYDPLAASIGGLTDIMAKNRGR